ncbi:MAG TPA: hypothetical protein VKL40_07350 [Candidatus Angelobacter sp.]|nr:hypothetical protein [Candidatus Angelobacter sp.]
MNLYRRRTLQASLVVLLAWLAVSGIIAQQRRKAHKLRATAVLELTTDPTGTMTARIVPITILDEGTFHDASVYKATPRPMAVDIGVVYEAQKSGQAVGYVTIVSAAKDPTWRGLGRWQVANPPAPEKSTAPVAAANTGSSDSDRPILRRGDSSNTAGQSPPASASPSPDATGTPAPVSSSVPTSEADDPDRPVLRRRGPEAAKQQPANPPPSAKTPVAAEGALPSTKLPVPAPGLQTMAAVSDADSSESRSFQFVWRKGEQEAMEAKMRRLALAQLPRENAQLTEHSLTNVVIRAFDLDLSNDAVMVLTAEIPGSFLAPVTKGSAPAKSGASASASPSGPAKFVSRYITLIARVNFEGNPQRLAVSVTDSSRLDVAPRLELIDAVDVDGDGLGELLFRQTSFDEKSYIIYGVGRGSVTKVFEGASQPLK